MKLHYQSYGEGFPLIMLHGLFGMLDNWHTVSRMLGGHFRVLALDQRNHGRSPHTPELSYEVMADDIRDFMAQQEISSAFVLGHSMGGKVAMATALRYPDLVEKLVVIDIAPRSYPSFHDSILEALTSLTLSNFSSRQSIDQALSSRIGEVPVRQFLMKNLARNDDGSFRWKMNLAVIAGQYSEVLKRIDSNTSFAKPTLFVRSMKSSYIGDQDIQEIKRIFPDSSIVDFETGHWVHAEEPERLTKVVTEFLLERQLSMLVL
jgi:pimeloyl-ACP methyl ester carboxylesterase